jgi:hypothetical protein
MAGGALRSFMLIRQVTRDPEGVTDPGVHHLSYAYLPHISAVTDAQSWIAAYAFNQPLIAVWRNGDKVNVQLPFDKAALSKQDLINEAPLPISSSLISAQKALVADVYRQGDRTEAVIIKYDLSATGTLNIGNEQIALPIRPLASITLPFIAQ